MRQKSKREEINEGLAAGNDLSLYEGKLGYWVQGDCVFIHGVGSAFEAIEKYRRELTQGIIAISHNRGCSAILYNQFCLDHYGADCYRSEE